MAGSESTQCPKCHGAHFSRSQWRSHQEKHGHPGLRPFRCRDCGHRFLAAAASAGNSNPWLYGAIAAAAVLLAATILVAGVGQTPERPPEGPASISMLITPELMKAAEGGDIEAQFSVATSMLTDSELSLAYSTKALDFLRQAAEGGHTRAMLRLGLLYRQGIGAPQNYALAAKWIEKAATSGEPQALLEFGRLHREGIGVPKDLVKAYAWLNLAAAARDPVAPRERAEVARLLTIAELQRAQSDSMAGNPGPTRVPKAAAPDSPSTPAASPATSPVSQPVVAR